MPTSRSGKKYFTQRQYETAIAASALEYARRQGYDLVGHGNRYHLREHDSMIFLSDGRWYWNSRHLSGRAFEFCREYEGRSVVDAVLLLSGEDGAHPPVAANTDVSEPAAVFSLPPQTSDATGILVKYLTERRCCDVEIVRELLRQRRVYISCRTIADNKVIRNAVFVSYDEHGVPVSAALRGINYGSHFKGLVPGSDKSVAWELPGAENAHTVAWFEAPIDAISHATLEKQSGIDWRLTHRLSLLGNPAPDAAGSWRRRHSDVITEKLCFDNDEAGQSYAMAVSKNAPGNVINCPPPAGKDWNEYLVKLTKEKEITK